MNSLLALLVDSCLTRKETTDDGAIVSVYLPKKDSSSDSTRRANREIVVREYKFQRK